MHNIEKKNRDVFAQAETVIDTILMRKIASNTKK